MRVLASLSLLLLLLPAAAWARRDRPEQLPRFTLPSAAGPAFDSATALAGHPALIALVRLGQDRSLDLLRDLEPLRRDFASSGLRVVAVFSGPGGAEGASRLASQFGLDFPLLLDPEHAVYEKLGVIVTPTTLFVDATGRVRFRYPGHWDDYAKAARTDIEVLLGRITEEERTAALRARPATHPKREVGGDPHYRLARWLLARGEREKARAQLEKAWGAQPPVPEAGIELGLLLLGEGKAAAALAYLDAAAKQRPDDARAMGARGVALIRSGRPGDGLPLLRRAVQRGVEEPLFFWELGRQAEAAGESAEALRAYKHGLQQMLRSAGPATP